MTDKKRRGLDLALQVLERFDLLPWFDCVCGASLQEDRDQKAEAIERCLRQLGGRAVMVVELDQEIDGSVLNILQSLKGILKVTYISTGGK